MEKFGFICVSILLLFLQLFPSTTPTKPSSSSNGEQHNEDNKIYPRQKHVDEETDKRIQEYLKSENNPREYIISISAKFSDGSEIYVPSKLRKEHKNFRDHKVYSTEALLKATNGIEVEYMENPRMEKAMKKAKMGNMKLLAKVEHEGGYVKFKEDINQAIVMGEDKDGTPFKIIKENVKFQRKKGDVESIWHLMGKIAKFDDRFCLPVECDDDQLDVLFDGHAMVALSVPDGVDENGNEKLAEIIRYHFNGNGLNIFLKDGNYNYVMKSHPNGFVNAEITVQRKRGQYVKGEFRPRLWSRKLSISKMNEIALNVVNGRPWGGNFKCHNFVYEFVQAIVAPEDLDHLRYFNSWPEVQCILNNVIINQDEGRSAFHKSVPYFYGPQTQPYQNGVH